MNVSVPLEKWLSAPPLSGMVMLIAAVAAVAIPTAFRVAVDAGLGAGLCTYLPFVTIAAFALDWRAAAAVTLASAFLGDYLFEGAPYQLLEMRCEVVGMISFIAASALIIGLVHAFRRAASAPLWSSAEKATPSAPVFSRKGGQACVSWYGGRSFVPLGPADEVEEMMRDFLAQQEVGRRLNRQKEMRGA